MPKIYIFTSKLLSKIYTLSSSLSLINTFGVSDDRLTEASSCQPVTSATSPLNKSQCQAKRPNPAATKC